MALVKVAVFVWLLLTPGLSQAGERETVSQEYLHWISPRPKSAGVTCDTKRQLPDIENRYGEPINRLCDSDGNWLQLKWVEQGRAVFNGAGVIPKKWSDLLLSTERKARSTSVGGWQEFQIWPAANPLKIPDTFTFQIVEGQVVDVKIYKGIVYLNFGENWKEDFTAAIPSHLKAKFKKENWNFDELVNMSIRVRGFVRSYNGPYMEIEWPTQIEILPQ